MLRSGEIKLDQIEIKDRQSTPGTSKTQVKFEYNLQKLTRDQLDALFRAVFWGSPTGLPGSRVTSASTSTGTSTSTSTSTGTGTGNGTSASKSKLVLVPVLALVLELLLALVLTLVL